MSERLKGNKCKIYMVGPSLNSKGGMASLLNIYNRYYKDALNLGFIPTYSGELRMKDILYFACAILRVFCICLFDKKACFHIHVSSGGSYVRKSMIARMCMGLGNKVVLHIHAGNFHDFLENRSTSSKGKIIRLLGRIDKIVVLSNSWYQYITKYVSPERVEIIGNPAVTLEEGQAAGGQPDVQLLFVGDICKRKGVYDLIEAVKCLQHRHIKVNIYGDGDVEDLRKAIRKSNLEHMVFIRGWVAYSSIGNIYNGMDIFVLPSYMEGLPMSILEAMGKGIPVISTNIGGIPEIVLQGQNGFIIEPGDIKGLAEKLELLICNEKLRRSMGKKSREIVEEKFSIAIIQNKLELMYRQLYEA